jgi:Flp pilus assembly protein TadD
VVIGELEKAIQCLQTGMERIPESRMLRLGLAEIYQKAERYEQAQALLQRSELRDDMQAMMLYIDVSCMREDYIGAFAFLERGIENRFAFGPETRLLLSEIYFQNGFATEADALLQSVQDEPALWPLIASARFKRADYRNAERYQLQHVNALKFPDPHAWMFLGDIYKQQGKEEEARKVYAKALSMMENKISPQASSELKKAAKSPTETN